MDLKDRIRRESPIVQSSFCGRNASELGKVEVVGEVGSCWRRWGTVGEVGVVGAVTETKDKGGRR